MPRHLHRDALRNARADEIANGGSTEVVGSSSPMQQDPTALRVLLEENVADSGEVTVTKRAIPRTSSGSSRWSARVYFTAQGRPIKSFRVCWTACAEAGCPVLASPPD